MNGRFFLDTKVFVYSFDASAPAKARRAAELIRQAVATGKGIVSFQVAAGKAAELFGMGLSDFLQVASQSGVHYFDGNL
jgi:predicted nucleic acid-binding protein